MFEPLELFSLFAFVAAFGLCLLVADLYRRVNVLQRCCSVLADRALKVNRELWRLERTTAQAFARSSESQTANGLQPGDVHPFTADAVVSISEAE